MKPNGMKKVNSLIKTACIVKATQVYRIWVESEEKDLVLGQELLNPKKCLKNRVLLVVLKALKLTK